MFVNLQKLCWIVQLVYLVAHFCDAQPIMKKYLIGLLACTQKMDNHIVFLVTGEMLNFDKT